MDSEGVADAAAPRVGGLKAWGAVASALMVVGVLFGAVPAGAQDGPPAPVVVPGFCSPISDLLDNAYLLPVDDEEFQLQLEEGARLLAELRSVAPAELVDALDALEAFSASVVTEVAGAGGIEGLSQAQIDDLTDRSEAVLEPIDAFFTQSCPGADVFAELYPECDIDGEILPPSLEIENFSSARIEVTAGDVVFTVDAEDFESRDVPAELTADEVLIDGVPGLVEVGSCDDFDFGPFEEQLRGLFRATFTSGCPGDTPPGMARLEVRLSAEGEANLEAVGVDAVGVDAVGVDEVGVDEVGVDEVDDEEFLGDEGLGRYPLPLEVDGALILAKFPAGLDLLLEADATAPEVKVLDVKLPVELRQAKCDGAPSGPTSTPAAAAPLTPKFTG